MAPADGVPVASVAVHPHSLELLEFPRVTAALAQRATSPRARAALTAAMPIAEASARLEACERLREAIRRQREPEPWCFAAPSELSAIFEDAARDALDP